MAIANPSLLLVPGRIERDTEAQIQLQQMVQGWCPAWPLLRRLGFRTRDEIDDERMALRGLPFGDSRQESGSTP
ncbi:MAG: hypothetical protein DCC72_07730 [Burkholderiales bacterium]|nr:MAG: hypothetical protein DCC72_07730 [Burkholderiales bacterium]